ncbi:DUF4111 domain-containing protein [Luteimonas sp. BDR2-5]|uniref:aminoglycoside adenylyltransferase family protein n=1 Tax=Proluteimonas luteida TaxID=2878685 RepID=UPI001E3B1026|nr:aminoglycoside adenylyltransferase family protein [Luteimonas sp. BDR2-5]MCD9028995.1 DUF4111 domain-containing protein [Luteimonas sp. BDR2-5]
MPPILPSQAIDAVAFLRGRLGDALIATCLYGSFVDGGLRPGSDLDLLCALRRPLSDDERATVMAGLLARSAPPGHATLRPLEVTCVVLADMAPWRHPARRELQFGEWLRDGLQAGDVPHAVPDPDLALLLAQARAKGIALHGPAPAALLPEVPARDVRAAIVAMLPDVARNLAGEELHALLTLARMWVTLRSGDIVPKDAAATRVDAWLPEAHRPALAHARAIYLGQRPGDWTGWAPRVAACARFMAGAALRESAAS